VEKQRTSKKIKIVNALSLQYLLVVLGLVLLWNLVKLACHGYHSNQALLMVVVI
jgi:hypothetical protein